MNLEKMTRDQVVPHYVDLILQDKCIGSEAAEINAAIIDRWSISALNYIKVKAWKIVDSNLFKRKTNTSINHEQ